MGDEWVEEKVCQIEDKMDRIDIKIELIVDIKEGEVTVDEPENFDMYEERIEDLRDEIGGEACVAEAERERMEEEREAAEAEEGDEDDDGDDDDSESEVTATLTDN